MIAAVLLLLQVGQPTAARVELEGGARNPAFARDGRLAIEARGDIWVTDAPTPNARWRRVTSGGAWDRAPAWSPDGKTIAVVLSVEGGSQIYLINSDGSGPRRRISNSTSIDTEPRYSSDGRWLYFTSDRGGSPQIYRMPSGGGEAQRVTFRGSYNVSPRPSPDGRVLAYVTRDAGKFQVALLDLSNQQVQVITDSDRDESPSFAPNGRMILLATVRGGRGVLSAVSADGRIRQNLPYSGGDVREPAWGPFIE